MSRGSVKVNGAKIREIREREAALERKELAEIVGISPAGIYEIEVHRQTTRHSTLRKIAEALEVKPGDLVG